MTVALNMRNEKKLKSCANFSPLEIDLKNNNRSLFDCFIAPLCPAAKKIDCSLIVCNYRQYNSPMVCCVSKENRKADRND